MKQVKICCGKCQTEAVPEIIKSHFAREQLYRLNCGNCGKYIKFINEGMLKAGVYATSGRYIGDKWGKLIEGGEDKPLIGKRALIRYEGERVLAQFDDRAFELAFGWHEFSAEEWVY